MSRIIIRLMYKTDPGYRKGMKVAIEEETGEILKKHYDNVYMSLTEEQRKRAVLLTDVDWELAGYEEVQKSK